MPARRVLDELSERLAELLPDGARELETDLRRNLRAAVEAALARLDVVSRDEFDAQTAVLARCRARVEALEQAVALLERAGEAPPPAPEPSRRD